MGNSQSHTSASHRRTRKTSSRTSTESNRSRSPSSTTSEAPEPSTLYSRQSSGRKPASQPTSTAIKPHARIMSSPIQIRLTPAQSERSNSGLGKHLQHPHCERVVKSSSDVPVLTRADAGFTDPCSLSAGEGEGGRRVRFSSAGGREARRGCCGRPRSPYPRPSWGLWG